MPFQLQFVKAAISWPARACSVADVLCASANATLNSNLRGKKALWSYNSSCPILSAPPQSTMIRKSDRWSRKRVAAKSRKTVTKGASGIASVQPVHPRCLNAVLDKQCGLADEKSVEDMARYAAGLPSDIVYCNKVLHRLKDVVYAVCTDYAGAGRKRCSNSEDSTVTYEVRHAPFCKSCQMGAFLLIILTYMWFDRFFPPSCAMSSTVRLFMGRSGSACSTTASHTSSGAFPPTLWQSSTLQTRPSWMLQTASVNLLKVNNTMLAMWQETVLLNHWHK